MKFIRITIIYILFFILLFNELYEIGFITISQLWKILLVFFLAIAIFSSKKKFKNPLFVKISFARSIKFLFNGGYFKNFFLEVLDFSRYILFFFIYKFLQKKNYSPIIINQFLYYLSVFIVLSFIPFYFEIFEQKGKIVNFSTDYNSLDISNFVGLFQGGHAAAISLAFSNLFLVNNLLKDKLNFKSFTFLLVLIGFYFQYLTLIRTGYVVLVFGLIILLIPKRFSFTKIVGFTSLLIFGFLLIEFLLSNNQAFYDRIFDVRFGNQQSTGSGRFLFWIAAIELWLNGSVFEILFGFGLENLMNATREASGLKVFSHNEFLTQLAQNGLIGFTLTVLFIYSLFKYIYKRKKSSNFMLSFAFVSSYLIIMLLQGGVWFFAEIFLCLSIYLTNYD